MLTLTQLAQLRDSTITYAERAAVWREACEIRTTQADAEQVVFFLQGQHDNNRALVTAAREINKYLDQTASVIEYKNRAIASLEDSIDELRGKIKGKDEGLARLQGEIVTLQAEITGLRHDITEHEERSDITEHEARSAVEIKGLKQQLTVAKEALSKEQATNADLRSMSDGLSTLVAKLHADHAQADSERQQLRIVAKQTEAKLGDLQRQYREVEETLADVRTEKDNNYQQLGKLNAQAGAESQQQRLAIRQLEERVSELQTQLNKAEEAGETLKEENTNQHLTIRQMEERISELQTQLNTATHAHTPIPGLTYAVRDVEPPPPVALVEDLKRINDNLRMELSDAKYARDQLKERRAELVKENQALRQTGVKQQLAEVGGDIELHAITQAIPLFTGLDTIEASRVLHYLTDRFARRVLE